MLFGIVRVKRVATGRIFHIAVEFISRLPDVVDVLVAAATPIAAAFVDNTVIAVAVESAVVVVVADVADSTVVAA